MVVVVVEYLPQENPKSHHKLPVYRVVVSLKLEEVLDLFHKEGKLQFLNI